MTDLRSIYEQSYSFNPSVMIQWMFLTMTDVLSMIAATVDGSDKRDDDKLPVL